MMNDELNRLISAWITGEISDKDSRLLSDRLIEDESARERFLELADLHSILLVDESLWEQPEELSREAGKAKIPGWFYRNPLAAAAAGIVLGTFFSSIVFASITTKAPEAHRHLVPLGNPGFESALLADLAKTQTTKGIWTGGISSLTGGESGVEPVEGQSMIRVKPRGPLQNGRIFQSIDLTELSSDQIRELELSASFHSDSSEVAHYFGAYLMGFDEPVVVDHQAPFFELIDGSLAMAKQNVKVRIGETGWTTVTVRLEVPPSASRLVICLSARAITKDGPPVNRYIDDVKLWSVTKSL